MDGYYDYPCDPAPSNDYPSDAFPSDKAFVFDAASVGGAEFLIGDVLTAGGERVLSFATPQQLRLLWDCRRWVLGGSSSPKLLTKPFVRLVSIHGLFSDPASGHDVTVPLAYALVSRRRRQEYAQVFASLFEALRGHRPCVEWVLVHLEEALAEALRDALPGTLLRSCAQQFPMAVRRAAKDLGLGQLPGAGPPHQLLRQLMGLNHLPPEDILPTFEDLSTRARATGGPHQEAQLLLLDSIRRDWLEHRLWGPDNLSCFGHACRDLSRVRTWFGQLSKKKKNTPSFFWDGRVSLEDLVQLLRAEAQWVQQPQWFMARPERPHTRRSNAVLAALRDDLRDGRSSPQDFLREVALKVL